MPRILIVEDEEAQRNVLKENLANNGFMIIEASDGIEGLEKAFNDRPDLILLDVRMPRMDGITMLHKLREDSWGRIAPVIILTNYELSDTQMFQTIKASPSYFLMKSDTTLEVIVEKVKNLLKEKKNGVNIV